MIVTVVTPTLNAIRYLRECIESVKRNEATGIEVEHVIVDDGSTDGTAELARSYGLRIIQGNGKGLFDAVNKGYFDSSGELIGFLGADDLLLEGGVEAIVRGYRRSGKLWVVGGIRLIDEHGNSLGGLAAPPLWLVPRLHVCLNWNPVMHMATYFSREFFSKLGGFNSDLGVTGDFEMFARARSRAPYERVSLPIACFRRTGTNYSVANARNHAQEIRLIRKTFGPKSALESWIWRRLLHAYIGLRNPSYLMHKTLGYVLWRLGLQEKKYL